MKMVIVVMEDQRKVGEGMKEYIIKIDEDKKDIMGNCPLVEKPQELVRCKDCEDVCIYSDDWVICTHIDSNGNDKHPTDWFCADGRKRDDT